MLNEEEKIHLITQISLDINKVKDLDILLERILVNVRKFFNADAGSIYLRQGDNLKFSYTQNDKYRKDWDITRSFFSTHFPYLLIIIPFRDLWPKIVRL